MDSDSRCQRADLGPILAKGWTGIEVRSEVDRGERLVLQTRLNWPELVGG